MTIPGGPGPAIDPEFTTKGVATAGMLGPGQAAWLSLPDTIQGANGMGLGSVLAGDEGGPLLSLSPSLPRPPSMHSHGCDPSPPPSTPVS